MSKPVRSRSTTSLYLVAAGLVWAYLASRPSHDARRFAQIAREPASKSTPVKVNEEAADAIREPHGTPLGSIPQIRPTAGWRYAYAFDRRITIRGLAKDLPPVEYHGTLIFDVIRVDNSGFEALVTDQILGRDQNEPITFRIAVDSDGKTLSMAGRELHGEAEHELANILKDLIAEWVFTLEVDTVGHYAASFERLGEAGGIVAIQKRKLSYLRVGGSAGAGQPTPEIVHSRSLIEWDTTRLIPLAVRGDEKTRMGSGDQGISGDSHFAMRFAGSGPIRIPSETLSRLTFPEALSLSQDPSERPETLSLTWPELEAGLLRLGQVTAQEQLKTFGELVKYLKTHADGFARLRALLTPSVVQQGTASPLFKAAVGALATVATEENQAELVSLYHDPGCPVNGKGTILSAMTTTQAPLNATSREFLLGESQSATNPDLADGAAFALGSSLHAAPMDDVTTRAIASLQSQWASATDDSRRLALLDVMGNSGRAEFMPIVLEAASEGGSAQLRSKAVFSLRFMSGAEAISSMGRALTDQDPALRQSAANAIQVAPWNPSFRAPLQKCVSSESQSDVLETCKRLLTRN